MLNHSTLMQFNKCLVIYIQRRRRKSKRILIYEASFLANITQITLSNYYCSLISFLIIFPFIIWVLFLLFLLSGSFKLNFSFNFLSFLWLFFFLLWTCFFLKCWFLDVFIWVLFTLFFTMVFLFFFRCGLFIFIIIFFSFASSSSLFTLFFSFLH